MNKLFVTALAVSLMSSATQKGISSDHFLTADNSGRHGTLLVRDSCKPAGNDLTAVRYIDYENGDDRNDGTREFPWQHHPWDENAQGNAAKSGNFRKYIFKKGVIIV